MEGKKNILPIIILGAAIISGLIVVSVLVFSLFFNEGLVNDADENAPYIAIIFEEEHQNDNAFDESHLEAESDLLEAIVHFHYVPYIPAPIGIPARGIWEGRVFTSDFFGLRLDLDLSQESWRINLRDKEFFEILGMPYFPPGQPIYPYVDGYLIRSVIPDTTVSRPRLFYIYLSFEHIHGHGFYHWDRSRPMTGERIIENRARSTQAHSAGRNVISTGTTMIGERRWHYVIEHTYNDRVNRHIDFEWYMKWLVRVDGDWVQTIEIAYTYEEQLQEALSLFRAN